MESTTQTPDIQENQPEKSKKGSKKVLFIILGIVVVLILAIIVVSALSPMPEVAGLELSDYRVEYNDNVSVTITYENPSMFASKQSLPIYVNDEVAFENVLKLKPHETRSETYDLSDLPAGDYTVSIEDASGSFTILSAPSFIVDMTVAPDFFVAGESNEIDFSVINEGESSGEAIIDIMLNGSVAETRSYLLNGGESVDDIFLFDGVDGESLKVDIGNATCEGEVYEVTPLVNATKLMKNTVKGYGYFEFTNYTDQDVIVYFTDYNNDSVAVSATVVSSMETVKISSFPHGSYAMFIQTGEYWVDSLGAFAKNQMIGKSTTEFEFENNVSKVYGGTYTYWTISYWGALDVPEYYTLVDNPPALGK